MEVEKQEKLVMTGRNKKTSNELSLKYSNKKCFPFFSICISLSLHELLASI